MAIDTEFLFGTFFIVEFLLEHDVSEAGCDPYSGKEST
jgi:hypothetical protein